MPGSGSVPYMVDPMAYMPSGVVPSPSSRSGPGVQPFTPSSAGIGAKTWYHPLPSFSKVKSVAVVLAALGASTTITCWAPSVSASSSTRRGLMSAVAAP